MRLPVKSLVRTLGVLLLLGPLGATAADGAAVDASHFGLDESLRWGGSGDTVRHDATYTFRLLNYSKNPVRVRYIGRSGKGLELLKPPGWAEGRTIRPHGSVPVTLSYHVTDCAGVVRGSWPLVFQASRISGVWRWLSLSLTPLSGASQWQESVAREACGQGGRGSR